MTQNNKILLGVGAFIVGGLGLYLIFKPNRRDNVYNPANIIDSNQFIGDIFIKPTRSVNFIQLNFVAVSTGVSFNEVVGAV